MIHIRDEVVRADFWNVGMLLNICGVIQLYIPLRHEGLRILAEQIQPKLSSFGFKLFLSSMAIDELDLQRRGARDHGRGGREVVQEEAWGGGDLPDKYGDHPNASQKLGQAWGSV